MSIPNWIRAWSITVQMQAGNSITLTSEQFDQPLRVVFSVEMQALLAYWQAEVTLYNATSGVTSQIQQGQANNSPVLGLPGVTVGQITQSATAYWTFLQPAVLGDRVSISAGYKYASNGAKFDPAANLLFQGNLFQPTWTRENVVDWKTRLRCLVGYQQDAQNLFSYTAGANQSCLDVINAMPANCKVPLAIDRIDDTAKKVLAQTQYPKSQTFHERPSDTLRDIGNLTKMQTWISDRGINVRSMKFDPNTVTPDLVYAPAGLSISNSGQDQTPVKRTLLGVPEQTQDGITFRVLMDAEPRIGSIVKLPTGTAINQVPIVIGQLPPIPNPSGLYVVAGIKHYGDSRGRGNDWYTEIRALTAGFFPDFLLNSPNVTQ